MLAALLASMLLSAGTAPPVTILFFTASWCEPCRPVHSLLETFARGRAGQDRLVTVDIDAAPAEAGRWAVSEVPVVVALSAGKVSFRVEGADRPAIAALQAELERVAPAPNPPRLVVLEAIGRASAPPDLYHVMMKMDSQAGLTAEAAAQGERQLAEFLAAVEALKIPGMTRRVSNNVFTASPLGTGMVYTRNIVFTLPDAPGRDHTIAALEDLGARYNSHCVTCIGSG